MQFTWGDRYWSLEWWLRCRVVYVHRSILNGIMAVYVLVRYLLSICALIKNVCNSSNLGETLQYHIQKEKRKKSFPMKYLNFFQKISNCWFKIKKNFWFLSVTSGCFRKRNLHYIEKENCFFYFLRFIYLFHFYIRVCLQLFAFVREHM